MSTDIQQKCLRRPLCLYETDVGTNDIHNLKQLGLFRDIHTDAEIAVFSFDSFEESLGRGVCMFVGALGICFGGHYSLTNSKI